MNRIIANIIRSTLTASVIVSGLVVSAEAAELRKKGVSQKSVGQQQLRAPRTRSASGDLVSNEYENALPDLIVTPARGGMCNSPSTVQFYVKNIGDKMAPASHAYVGFQGSSTTYYTVSVPIVPRKKQVLITAAVPHPFNQESFTVLVGADHFDAMQEESVTNNFAQDQC